MRLFYTHFKGENNCFNPRTRKGCDKRTWFDSRHNRGFNPRTRKGCDIRDFAKELDITVSIHAPVKDATGCISQVLTLRRFQSTHP